MDYVDYRGQKLVKAEYDAITKIEANTDIEKGTGAIPIVSETNMFTFGIVIQDNHVIGLGLNKKGLISLPESIGNLTSLQRLYLGENKLTSVPDSIGKLTSLQQLGLRNNQLTSLPENIKKLTSLQYLDLGNNHLTSLPESIGNLTSLQQLYLYNNKLTSLPECIGNLTSLQQLYLRNNILTSLPESIGKLTSLQQLGLGNNKLTSLPNSFGNLTCLKELDLEGNQLSSLPNKIGPIESLRLGNNKLKEIPLCIKNSVYLKYLDLSNNQILRIEHLENLSKLNTVYLDENNLSNIDNRMVQRGVGYSSTALTEFCRKQKEFSSRFHTHNDASARLRFLMLKTNLLPNEDFYFLYSPEDLSTSNLEEFCNRLKKIFHEIDANRSLSLLDDLYPIINVLIWKMVGLKRKANFIFIFLVSPHSLTCNKCNEILSILFNASSLVIPIKHSSMSWATLENLGINRKYGYEFNSLENLSEISKIIENIQESLDKYINPIDKKKSIDSKLWNFVLSGDENPWVGYCTEMSKFRIFFSHSTTDFDELSIESRFHDIAELTHFYYCEKDLSGDIDEFMNNFISKSDFFIFFATENSLDSRDCIKELELAIKLKIPLLILKNLSKEEILYQISPIEKISLSIKSKEFGDLIFPVNETSCIILDYNDSENTIFNIKKHISLEKKESYIAKNPNLLKVIEFNPMIIIDNLSNLNHKDFGIIADYLSRNRRQ